VELLRLVVEKEIASPGKPDSVLLKAVAREHHWVGTRVSGSANSVLELAAR
jgi:hypothetical protein